MCIRKSKSVNFQLRWGGAHNVPPLLRSYWRRGVAPVGCPCSDGPTPVHTQVALTGLRVFVCFFKGEDKKVGRGCVGRVGGKREGMRVTASPALYTGC